jgi:predicted ATPase/class 3 adenylate cyclase/tetratricopeptide (TPR) repeat protein
MLTIIPSGTVTFLFTDIEGSTSLAQRLPDAIQAVLARHHAILRNAIEAHGGTVFQIIGDAVHAAFHTVGDAMQAALDAQHGLAREDWAPAPVRVRMGINTGAAQAMTETPHSVDYKGYLTLTRTQRVMSVAHGGQILLSNASADLAREGIRGDIDLRDLGEHRLKGLPDLEHIWQVLSPGLQEDFPALGPLHTIPGNLPVQLTSFIGREKEIREVRQLLETHRLVTLTGSGGAGKTRLSLQVAAEVLDRFKDGVWFIELAPLSDPDLVPNTVASALGVREEPGRSLATTLLDWLGSRELLLVVDNCEHLIESCAIYAQAVLQAGRGAHILASSREPFAIPGEQAYLVPPLESPTPEQAAQMPVKELLEYPAVRLFTERARESLPTFRLTPPNVPAVVQICRRLDGIPLALELAAARVRVLHVEQIAERLDDRFRLLTDGRRTALPHHQTLRSLIDWSYDLLTEPEQLLLRRLSAFSGGWTLTAAERVCVGEGTQSSEVLELLGHLVDKSLVMAEHSGERSRYHMLETIRKYARKRLWELDEGAAMRSRHLQYFVELAEEAEPRLHSAEQLAWIDCLEMERGNCRAALEWAEADGQIEMGLRMAGALYPFWELRGYWSEGYDAVAGLLKESVGERSVVRARALIAAGKLAANCGYSAEMHSYFGEGFQILQEAGKGFLGFSLSLYAVALVDRDPARAHSVAERGVQASRETGDILGLATSLYALGMVTRREVDFAAARVAQEESMMLFRDLGDQQMYALLLSNLAYTHFYMGNLLAAQECFDESIGIAREIGDRYVEANSLPGRGDLARRLGKYDEAASMLQRAYAYHRELGGAHQGLINGLHYLGLLELSRGNRVEADRYLNEGVAAAGKGNLRFFLRFLLDAMGYLAAATDARRAARLFGSAERLREQLGTRLYPYEHDEYERYVELARLQLDEASWKEEWNEGRGMTLEQSIEYALRSD